MAEHDTPYDGIKCSRWSCCHWTLRKGKGRVCSLLWLPGRVRIPTPFWIPCSEGLMRLDEFAPRPRLPLLFFSSSSFSSFFYYSKHGCQRVASKIAIKKVLVYRCIKLRGVVKFLFCEKSQFYQSLTDSYIYICIFFREKKVESSFFFSDFFFFSIQTNNLKKDKATNVRNFLLISLAPPIYFFFR